ncbi:MAG: hypothetical protein Q4G03_05975 [Planctomycetia bacterium]|nr:hypothetical protein [Planctomycetia bacterium]
MRHILACLTKFAILALTISLTLTHAYAVENAQLQYQCAVLNDWLRQEQDRGLDMTSPEALQTLLTRAENFLQWAQDEEWYDEKLADPLQEQLEQAREELKSLENNDAQPGSVDAAATIMARYVTLRNALRRLTLSNPSVVGQPILFLKEERFTWQMLHEYLSYYYNVCGMHGGGVYKLKAPGQSFEVESLTDGRFPIGVFQTLSMSYDAKSIYFSFADFCDSQEENVPKTDVRKLQEMPYIEDFNDVYMKKSQGKFHLYRMSLVDGEIEQLTDGPEDDFDPVEAPDGAVIFMSTRRGGYGRCHGYYEPLNVHTLHRLNPDKSVQCLSWHETNEWQPSFLNDGRLVYTRWDYVDRAASKHHGLWTTNPDGTNSAGYFGNYTYEVNACYQAKAIPNSNKIMFVGGAHHLDVGGALLLFDPTKARYDEQTGFDDMRSIAKLTPDVELPERADNENAVCKQYYFSPWPLSEETWLVSYSHDPLGGYLGNTTSCGKLALYYGDAFGNLELLYENQDSNESCLYPIPMTQRPVPPTLPSALPKEKDVEPTGTFVLSNVYESLLPFPEGRKIKELRVVQLLPKAPDYRSDSPRTGRPNSVNARAFLGTVPVEEDGSAHFTAPANVPLYFQAVDEQGKAVQSMRSIVYLQPGESRGCVGCHEQTQTIQTNDAQTRSLASLREPSALQPGPQDAYPISYVRLIQPILDRRCVGCHNGEDNSPTPNLSGDLNRPYLNSYTELLDHLRWYEWGGSTYRNIVTRPGECGADISPLTQIIDNKEHAPELTDDERRTLYLWCDLNIPFYGVYEPEEQEKQLSGLRVQMPTLQ